MRHDLRGHQAAADHLVPGHAPADPGQEQRLGPRTQAPSGRALQDGLAAQAQADAGHERAGRHRASLDGRVEIDDAYLGGELPGGKSGRGSENKVSFIAAVQTTETGHPLRVCLKKLEFTKEAIAEWAKTALAASARVVSDGLWCFKAVTAVGGNAGAHRDRRRPGLRQAGAVPRGQYLPRQSEDRLFAEPTTPSTSPSTPIAILPRSNIDSIAASICRPS